MTNKWKDEPNGNLLVDCEWVAKNINDEDLRIFDCTTRLIPDPKLGYRIESAEDNWAVSHIMGSGYLNCQNDMCDTSHKYRFMLADPDKFAKSVGNLGIGDDTRVVLYSTSELFWSTRAWWALYANGFNNAYVLNGGFKGWVSESRQVSSEPCNYKATTFTPNRRDKIILNREDVLSSLDRKDISKINALSPEQFQGTGGMAFGRPGHIPGSGNAPYAQLANMESGILNDPETVKDILYNLDIKPNNTVINYCGGGISATIAFFAQKLLGYENIGLYDASMQEWGFDESLPIELGK